MRRITTLFVLIIISMFLLESCNSNSEKLDSNFSITSKNKNTISTQTLSSTQNWNKLSNSWNGKKGVYTIERYINSSSSNGISTSTDNNYSLIHFFDYTTLNSIVLCNKPNCKHDDDNCNAYFINKEGSQGIIFEIKNKLYIIIGGTIYSMNEDGTNREAVIKLPEKYTSLNITSNAFLIDNKVYLETNYLDDGKIQANSNDNDNDENRTAVFMIDIQSKTYKLMFSFNSQNAIDWLGIIGNKYYFLYQDSFQSLKSHTQAALDEQNNNRNTKVFCIDSLGKQTDLFSGKSKGYDDIILRGNFIYYQNRETGEIIKYNPANNEKKALVSNLKTYIRFFNMDLINNKLFYMIDYESANAYSKKTIENVSYYVDVNTGKNDKISYRIPCDNNTTKEFSGFAKITPDYYIVPMKYLMSTQQYVNSSETYEYIKETKYGKISKNDFWDGKYSVQAISWHKSISGK